ncbi:MAG: MaoC family dehydratase N-terminal domain-containing protein [Deltaproteobacteria bacterium]|nr:MaoC family dehydratase N-terminal domain-containing protein [Deltaproteobacteria bacterium]MBW1924608.1 MaoC family dehydratase N-terminal domain-containing protein [Deltaproteobacteria bacterium]MBW1950266.1 MaoC family dehydratase N-terminal domain-containing protein [Deltaproteobacteria bacterium]MBW2008973.1 MaoC family dehydratase N-terminal domain-containing protein [Deltaproteobacteria bacterium]MBW2346729.1 MaoC family dehydratase N-terminal domain-containing protein [Deltaproteobac
MSKYFEDFTVGETFRTPGKTVERGTIDLMIGLAGFTVPLFNDALYAEKSVFGERIAPGRLTLFIMGALEEQMGIYDETVIALVGIDKVRFKAPLRAGDTIHVEFEVKDLKPSRKPDRGIMVHRSRCVNQRGEVLVECEAAHLMKRRPV